MKILDSQSVVFIPVIDQQKRLVDLALILPEGFDSFALVLLTLSLGQRGATR